MALEQLSKTLRAFRHPEMCQRCSKVDSTPGPGRGFVAGREFQTWEELAPPGAPSRVFIVLCQKCAGELAEQLASRYMRMKQFTPLPGTMRICGNCIFHKELACTHADLKTNGGPGMDLRVPRPDAQGRQPHEPNCKGRIIES